MLVIPNPYHCLDHKSRLAGAFPEVEDLRDGTKMPLRRHVGARLEMVEGSYRKGNPEAGIGPSADTYWLFNADPVEVFAEGQMVGNYLAAIRSGELLDASSGVPTAELAKARAAAIAAYRAAYAKDPDESTWAVQFAIDPQVKAASEPPPAPAAKAAKTTVGV